MTSSSQDNTYGLLAQFPDTDSIIRAAQALTDKGYRRVDAYTPLPIEGLAEALNYRRSFVPHVVFFGGLTGCTVGFMMQYLISVVLYPLNIGGRPPFSWPMFIPVTFECTIFCAAFSGVIGMILMNGLPRYHHPLFGVNQFARASSDGYFIGIEAADPLFDIEATTQFLKELHAKEVLHVPAAS